MADDTTAGPGESQLGLLKQLVEVLKAKPAYALVFSALFFVYAFSFAGLAMFREGPDYFIYSLIALTVALVVTATVVNSVERIGGDQQRVAASENSARIAEAEVTRLKSELEKADHRDVNISDPALASSLTKIIDNVRQATAYESTVFKEEIGYRLASMRKESDNWERGDLITDGANYERILQRFYREAAHSVFATSNDEYLPFWRTPASKGILQAHAEAYRKSETQVTRVFIFSSFDRISPDELAIIKEHARPKHITAKVFIFDESQGAALGASLFKDFVIIDQGRPGQAVGVTNSFDVGAMGAKWMMEADADIEQAARFIRDHWIDIDEVEQRMERRQS